MSRSLTPKEAGSPASGGHGYEPGLGGEGVEVDDHDDRVVAVLLQIGDQVLVRGVEERDVVEALERRMLHA